MHSADVIRPINGPDFIRPWDRNVVLLEYGQHHPEREGGEKVQLMGHCCTPHLHLDITVYTQALFKVTAGSTLVLFSKDRPMTRCLARKFAHYIKSMK